jgi:sugar fermentation stimulation protein A
MRFPRPLVEGRLIRRYKRFLADIQLAEGVVTAACPNTGSLMGCCEPGSRVWLSESDKAGRKYRHTWELVEVGRTLVGINTGLPNRLVAEALESGVIAELAGYTSVRREVAFALEPCYVEVKNVTAAAKRGVALFPDCVSDRGARHLRELARLKRQGMRPVQVYCVQRGDVREVRPADVIDPVYGQTLREAMRAGVEVLAYRARVTASEIRLAERIAVVAP